MTQTQQPWTKYDAEIASWRPGGRSSSTRLTILQTKRTGYLEAMETVKELVEVLRNTWGRGGTVGTHLPACNAMQGPFPRPLMDRQCNCGFDAAQAVLARIGDKP